MEIYWAAISEELAITLSQIDSPMRLFLLWREMQNVSPEGPTAAKEAWQAVRVITFY